MSSWLAKATKTLSRSTAAEPEPYEVTCACRNDVRGMRGSEFQVERCSRCGVSLFILPRNPYPRPKTVARKKSPAKSKKGSPSTATKTSSRQAAVSAEDISLPLTERLQEKIQQAKANAKLKAVRSVQRTKALFTPFRMVMLALTVVVAATAYWYWHAKQVERAEVDLSTFAKLGEEAFGERDYLRADEHLSRAGNALDVLERDDPHSRHIRQLQRQAAAITHLLEVPLLTVVESTRDAASHTGYDRGNRFRSQYGSQWIVLHSTMEPYTDENGTPSVQMLYPLRVDDKPILIAADAEVFSGWFDVEQPREAVLGARLQSCRQGGPHSDHWVVRLDPQSVFLWSDFDSLVELGLAGENDPIQKIVEQQARSLEIEP